MGKRDRNKATVNLPTQPIGHESPSLKIVLALIAAIAAISVAIIGYLGNLKSAALPIEATQTAEVLRTSVAMTNQAFLYQATNSPMPSLSVIAVTYTPSETPIPVISDAIISMNNYFQTINKAQTRNDLTAAWNLETTKLQCADPIRCDLLQFQDYWLYWTIRYKLYDCGLNIVDTEQVFYLRDPNSIKSPISVAYKRYELKKDNEQLKINNEELIQSPGSYCHLVISAP